MAHHHYKFWFSQRQLDMKEEYAIEYEQYKRMSFEEKVALGPYNHYAFFGKPRINFVVGVIGGVEVEICYTEMHDSGLDGYNAHQPDRELVYEHITDKDDEHPEIIIKDWTPQLALSVSR